MLRRRHFRAQRRAAGHRRSASCCCRARRSSSPACCSADRRSTSSRPSSSLLVAGDDLDHAQPVPGAARARSPPPRRQRPIADQMREQARTDVVTGLLNRAGLNHELVEQLMRCRRAASWRCSGSISTASRKSTTRSATRSATACSPKSRGASRDVAPAERDHRPLRRRRVHRRVHRRRPRRDASNSPARCIGDLSRPYRIDGNRIELRRLDGRRAAARRRPRHRDGDAERRPGALSRQGRRAEPDQLLRPGDDPRPRAQEGDRGRAARGDPQGRAVDLLPADRRPRDRPDPHLRGAGALVPPREGRTAPRRVHPGRRGDRRHHHARQLDHRAGGQGRARNGPTT